MKQAIWNIAVLAISCLAGTTQAQAPVTPLAPLPYVTPDTPLGTGPYKAIMEEDAGLAKHTVYRPKDVTAVGSKLSILAWGNGGCNANGNAFRPFLTEIASHGYLAIANGTIGPASAEAPPAPATAQPPRPAGATGPVISSTPPTNTAQLIEAIDWAIAENSRPGSRYYGKLDTSKIAIAGQSCGGVQAIEASVDPRVKTTIVGNSGLMPTPTTMTGSGKPVPKESLKLMHAPTLYMSGDDSDIAYPNANDDFEKINHIPVFRAYEKGIGHGGTYRNAEGGSFGKVAVAWLAWQLNSDRTASKMFVGADCGLCSNPAWVVRKKGID